MKQVRVLSPDYHVTTASFGEAPEGSHEHIQLERYPKRTGLARIPGIFSLLELLHLYRWYERIDARIRRPLEQLAGHEWDLIIAHDLQTLPIASRLTSHRGVLVDLHEYAPAQDVPTLGWKVLTAPRYRWMCRTHVRRAAAVTTVSQGIADEYRRRFDIDATVVVNATLFHDLQISDVTTPIRLVHSGVAAPERRLDILVEGVVKSNADVTLDFYLVDAFPDERARLAHVARNDPRVHFHDAVPYAELVPLLNTFDVGVSVFPPTTFNLAWCLPNKFFDFIQARLGVIVGPSPEMERVVTQYGLGVVTEDFTPAALARSLDALTPAEVAGWKARAHENAHALAGESQSQIWADMVARLLR
jgi:glycosyltransferase involved in cell wall biosynthesis